MEERVTLRAGNGPPACKKRGTADSQLAPQVLPLEGQLALCDGDGRNCTDRPELAPVKTITARQRFSVDRSQVGIDREARAGMRASVRLGMMEVAPGFAPEDSTRKQRFTP